MQVWCFAGTGGLWALCGNERGEGLPADLGPWTFRKAVTLGSDGEDERQARALIGEHGFCCFTANKQN
jgi:hypothetical protein